MLDGDWSDWEALEDKVQLKTELSGHPGDVGNP